MRSIRKLCKTVSVVLTLTCAALFIAMALYNDRLPERFQIRPGETLKLSAMEQITVGAVPPTVPYDTQDGTYNATLRLFGLIPIKEVSVSVAKPRFVELCGTPFGVKMFTDGVLIVGMTDVDGAGGLINPAKNAGLRIGDVIVSINGVPVMTNEDVAQLIESAAGRTISMKIRRKNLEFPLSFQPEKSAAEGKYKAGLWVRDSSAGIGTLTFIAADTGIAAGLGHGICDVDTGEILPISAGELVAAEIIAVTKGAKGKPGELHGRFTGGYTGALLTNCDTGVYGRLPAEASTQGSVQIALRQDVKTGAAKILTTLDDTGPHYYDCVIERVNYDKNVPTQNMTIRVTDKALLQQTGGIVQGMSGSPILQNNRLVGAVTHVFINDSSRGYGIFAENMLLSAAGLEEAQENKKAS